VRKVFEKFLTRKQRQWGFGRAGAAEGMAVNGGG